MYYVTTADLDGTLARAKAKGARVLNGPMDVPGGQRIVQLMDPQRRRVRARVATKP
jgi:hypothetical protein